MLYKSIVLPKLTYGLEICYLNATSSLKLETAARNSLKYLFNLSKRSLNLLSDLVYTPSMKDLMNVKKVNIVHHLMRNPLTRSILLNSATAKYSSFWKEISVICELYITIYDGDRTISPLVEQVRTLFKHWSQIRKSFTR